MITPAQRAEIRRLYFGERWKVGTIAAQLGLHHETVRAAVERETTEVRRGVCRRTILDPDLPFMLVVRGPKHHPQDLERTAEGRHRAVRPGCVAAFVADHCFSGDGVALVAEVDPHKLESSANAQAAIAAIRSGVTDAHGIQLSAVALVAPGGVEKTTSGKVKRFACREALLAGTLESLAIWRQTPPRDARAARGTASPVGPVGRGQREAA